MNILMMTNTFTPHVGGVARSVVAFSAEYRRRGHQVLVVAPSFDNMPEDEVDVVRIPAIQRFNGSDFSVVLPMPGYLTRTLENFQPDLIHSHHPFLLGATALRVAHSHQLPLVFTHHTMYEQYTHYVPGDSQALKRFTVKLTTSYANLCDLVFAPSASIATILQERQCTAPIEVIPTGVRLELFQQGDGPGFRAAMGIPAEAFVVGHLGRLAPEKNLAFLARTVAAFLQMEPAACFLVVGQGPFAKQIRQIFQEAGVEERLYCQGILEQPLLASAYRAMNVFAFASLSETQGMVLTEAMAAGVPVVAVAAPGVREVVCNGENGMMLPVAEQELFLAALTNIRNLPENERKRLRQGALETAQRYSLENCADKALKLYADLCAQRYVDRQEEYSAWKGTVRLLRAEWEILKGVAGAAGAALSEDETLEGGAP